MKSNIIKLSAAMLITTVAVIITACNKKLDVLDKNNPSAEDFFKTAGELQNAVNGVYSILRGPSLVEREWWYTHDMRGGECASGGPQLEARRFELMSQPAPSPANTVMFEVWRGCYRMINRANVILAKAPAVTDNTALRDRVIGEAKFLRAWAYYELVAQWGGVPLYTEPVASSTDFKGRAAVNDIYALIVTDLQDAAQKLPASYDVADNGRATSGAANAMLGRVLMQKGDYRPAKDALLKVYGKYSLVPTYRWNFDGDVRDDNGAIVTTGHEFNAESIFEVVFIDKGDNVFNWDFGALEWTTYPTGVVRGQEYGITWGNVIPSDNFLNEFEANDPRYKFSIFEEGDKALTESSATDSVFTSPNMNIAPSKKNGVTLKRFIRKYGIYDWVYSNFHLSGLNYRLIRYADVLLMLAECEAEVGTPLKAADYINEVRSRPDVNMLPVATLTKEAALKAVMHERAVELGAEAISSFDLVRWRAKGYFPSIKADPVPGQVALFPIPASESSANPLLK